MKLLLLAVAISLISCTGDFPPAVDMDASVDSDSDSDADTDTDTDADADSDSDSDTDTDSDSDSDSDSDTWECTEPADCADAYTCTVHDCNAHMCQTWVSLGWCLVEGQCVVEGAHDPLDSCQVCDNSANYYDWSNADGIPCQDQYACTYGDTCVSGSCQGTFYSCDDGLGCTDDSCEGDGGCDFDPQDGRCALDGACYDAGVPNPSNPCLECNPSLTQDLWSNRDGVFCDDSDPCTADDTCAGGGCGGDIVEDSYEPNDSSASPFHLGGTGSSDGWPEGTVTATLFGPGDNDVFTFDDDEDFAYAMRPRVDLTSIPTGYDYELCAYFQCDSADSNYDVACQEGDESTWGSLQGCCSTNGPGVDEQVILNPDCRSGITDDSGKMFVFVSNYSTTDWTCQQYSLSWGDS